MRNSILFGILTLVLLMPIISVNASEGNSTNISSINNGLTWQGIKENLHNFMVAKQQATNADKAQELAIEKYREFYKQFVSSHPFPTVNQSGNWALKKIKLAHEQGYALTWYDIAIENQKIDMLEAVKEYLANGRNTPPAFVNCHAWHNCTVKPFIPHVTLKQQMEVLSNSTLGNYSIPIKPEFLKNPSGYINGINEIKNLTDYQKYMTQKEFNASHNETK